MENAKGSKLLSVVLVLAALFVLAACARVPQKTAPSPDAQQAGGYQTISAEQAQRLIGAEDVAIVDVREPDEYAAGHLIDATLIPLGTIEETAVRTIPDKNATILVYCRSGVRSADASQKLAALGYTNVYNLDGGISAWTGDVES